MVEQMTDATFGNIVENTELPILIDFWAPWCGPCRAMAPVLEELSKEYKGTVLFYKMNVDENPQTPQTYGVRAIPTLVLIKKGDTLDQITGAVAKDVVKRMIDPYAKGLE